MRHNARKDSTHDEIRDALLADGWHVTETHKCGGGLPDMFATCWPMVVAVEAKSEGGTQTPAERDWEEQWNGPYIVPYSGAEAVALARPFLELARALANLKPTLNAIEDARDSHMLARKGE